MSKVRLNRVLALVLAGVMSIGLLAGCAAKLPDGYDELTLKTSAESVIDLLNQRDSEGLTAILTEEMKVGLTPEVIGQIFALLDESGSMQEIADMKVGSSEENGITFAFVVARVKYEKAEITYTIGFDKDMKLAGLYLK